MNAFVIFIVAFLVAVTVVYQQKYNDKDIIILDRATQIIYKFIHNEEAPDYTPPTPRNNEE